MRVRVRACVSLPFASADAGVRLFSLWMQGLGCVCPDGPSGAQCRRLRGPCSLSPCLNNGSCVALGDDYACR